ncbi:hypothetical protein JTE90_021044 [Oedothorax gibbosus]|uniref:Uncharacterized protein n=1 Tax=Oedothorax gibbosus TaxID=931172 RepID=A0AAV6VRB2_9ARAC|nr:hypothetical protein JTE90_021044 [Oedothorax gibbosus]
MGEGVTNPVRGAAASSSPADPVSSSSLLLCSSVLLLIAVAGWIFRARKKASDKTRLDRNDSEEEERHVADVVPKYVPDSESGFSEPRLRWSAGDCQSVSPLLTPALLYDVTRCATERLLPARNMDDQGDAPSGVSDPQPDSFFTWDSGGSSGDYSFVHTAVELPKYPDGAITEEERQMLLLYMQTGHPELLLQPSQSGNVQPMACDPVAVRGFLETIVEENSDDLRSPSECDENSLGWGSWDESDEDRLTVVEMVTSTTNDFAANDAVHYSVDDFLNSGIFSQSQLSTGEGASQGESRHNLDKDKFCDNKDMETTSGLLSGVIQCDDKPSHKVTKPENENYMDNTISSIKKCENKLDSSKINNKPSKMDINHQPGVSSHFDSINSNGNFDNFWISSNTINSPNDNLNPWTTIDFKEHAEDDNVLTSLDISNPEQIIEGLNPLLVLGTDDICLVPSNFNSKTEDSENLMFSDSFKDYFLPSENYTPAFNKNVPDLLADFSSDTQPHSLAEKPIRCLRIGFGSSVTEETSVPSLDAFNVNNLDGFANESKSNKSMENSLTQNTRVNEDTIRCLRLGFEDDTPSEEYLVPSTSKAPFFSDSESLNIFHMENQSELHDSSVQDAMFSPLDGDIVYGSTWANPRGMKEPEKKSTGTEVQCSAARADVHRELTMLSDSPPSDIHRPASDDDDISEVPNSLSRWRHHTDLQHLQEDSSPITRWQHHGSLQLNVSKQTDSEESDDGLPPQLKEIYSSFKMRDNKMGRIRIKEDKNNNFKRLGLWEKESKVTLPDFNKGQPSSSRSSPPPIKKESNGGSKEDLDDLEFDMFAVTKNPKTNNIKNITNGDSDIDDALQSFNHLDDYSSESEADNSESENCYVVNVRDNKEIDVSEVLENEEGDSIESNIEDKQASSSGEMPSLENPCSDNSDNCPLCADPSFKNSHITDIFSPQNIEKSLQENVQSLLENTYPKMIRLSLSNLSDAEVIESNGESNKTGDSISPITTSDSDEGIRKKEIKKRVKKRSKDNSSTELKHDDSGYVEDDEDDDDSLAENSEKLSSTSSSTDVPNLTRKSLSTAFYESKSNKIQKVDSILSKNDIPESFQEFSKQLDLSLSTEEIKAGFVNEEKWNVPENLSQFSAWLLDKELKKISNRDEVEKLLVDDMMSLREQTIAKFLKNSSSDESLNLKLSELTNQSDISASVPEKSLNIENHSSVKCSQVSDCDEPKNTRDETSSSNNNEIEWDFNENITKDTPDSENELPEEYYSYNLNSQVSKIFEQNINDDIKKTSIEQPNYNLNEIKPTDNSPMTIIHEASSIMTANSNTDETKLQNNNTGAETEPETSPTDEYNLQYNNLPDLCTELIEAEPLNDNNSAQQSTPVYPSVTPTPEENTREILPKVNDTTIGNEKENKASPQVSIENVNSDDSTAQVNEVAASGGRNLDYSYSFDAEEVDPDLMTRGVDDEKCDRVVLRSDGISTPEAAVVRASDFHQETHVYLDECHAFPDKSDLLQVSGPQNIAPELENNNLRNNYSDIVESVKADSGSEEVVCLPARVASPPTQQDSSGGFTIVDYSDSLADYAILKDEKNALFDRNASVGEVGGSCLSNDLETICDNTHETHKFISIEQSSDKNKDEIKCFEKRQDSSNLNNSKDILDIATEDSGKFCLIHSNEIEEFGTNIPVYRDYQRSNSLGRDNVESDETFELWNGQSKSTPDLRNCHDQQKKTNAPLSVRLSKSVSQRIEDYLGSRDSRLNKSLPPNERSRHYRRICVSTETVVEKAARFEARSKSTCSAKELSDDRSPANKRSGSCPPSSMRNNTSWISDRPYRNYNKPTATVRPTVDMHRNGSYNRNDLKGTNVGHPNEKENMLELITGYSKATKVTHKPPVAPSSTNLQQSLKSARLKGKIANARKDFFERLSQQDLSSSQVTKKDYTSDDFNDEPLGLRRFDEFRRSAREERARLVASHPDLGALEAAVRSSKRKIDQLKKRNRGKSGTDSYPSVGPMPSGSADQPALCLPYRRATGEIAWASCAARVQEAKRRSKRAHEQLEIVEKAVRAQPCRDDPAVGSPAIADEDGGREFVGSRARSMDFLLDADNREQARAPENRLSAGGPRVKSEHELRIERSLQNLTVPDWYKQSAWSKKPTEGFILRRGSEGSAGESRKRWQGLSSSRNTSTTSLHPPNAYSSQRNISANKRPSAGDWRYAGSSLVSSRESLTPASPASLSPRECTSAAFQYGIGSSLSRWSSSRLSTSSAPLTALSVHRSFRQPYLGWRAAAASSSGGTSPVSATTPVTQGSRSESPRRGSQDHQYGYGLQQNQITCAATLRPDSAEQPSDSNRISPLALHTTNIFFNTTNDNQPSQPIKFGGPELRRDRYSYTQSLYSGTVIVSPLQDPPNHNFNIYEEDLVPDTNTFRIVSSPQPPRVWMESSFVGTKKDGDQNQTPPPRTIRIIPSDSTRATTSDRFGTVPGASSSVRGGATCATQTAMGGFCNNTKPALSLKSIQI